MTVDRGEPVEDHSVPARGGPVTLPAAHRLVRAVQHALGRSGTDPAAFTRGAVDPTLCERLLSPTRLLDIVMRRALEPPKLRCFQDGTELNPREYLSGDAHRGLADMDRITALSAAGFTLVLDGLDTYDATLEVACRALQWWSRELVSVNAYLTTGRADGFRLHWDDHDVIVVQLAGEKSWEVRGSSRPYPLRRDAEPNLTPSEDVLWAGTARPGDVMSIPRGYWHQATRRDRDDGLSLHVTFGFARRTGVDWLAWLADRAREDELFRRDLVDGDPSGDGALAEAAARLVAEASPSEFLAWRERVRPPARHLTPPDGVGPASTVVCVTEFEPHLDAHGATVTLLAAGRRITLRASALPALGPLLSGRPTVVGRVAAESGVNALGLARTLVEQGICAVATPDLLTGYADLVE